MSFFKLPYININYNLMEYGGIADAAVAIQNEERRNRNYYL